MQQDKIEIEGVTLFLTCGACPEQYDAVDANSGKQLGYLRLRHGNFTVECPDVNCTLVYSASPLGDGLFHDYEREVYLKEAVNAIKKFHGMTAQYKYVVAVASIENEKNTQWVVDSDNELNAAIFVLQLCEHEAFREEFECTTLEELKTFCITWDMLLSVVKV